MSVAWSAPAAAQAPRAASQPAGGSAATGPQTPAKPASKPDEGAHPTAGKKDEPNYGTLPGALALVPGVAVHGMGHYAAGDTKGGNLLLASEGAGLGAILVGGVPLALTGASRRLVGPAIGLIGVGAGVFVLGIAADVYGASGAARIMGRAPKALPTFEGSFGIDGIYDPQFKYRRLHRLAFTSRLGPVRIKTAHTLADAGSNQRARYRFGYRLWRTKSKAAETRGSRFYSEVDYLSHRYGDEGFHSRTFAIRFPAHLELGGLHKSLAGAFVTGHLGWGLQAIRYTRLSESLDPDANTMLLMGFGFGSHLPGKSGRGGSWRGFYRHRRDGYVGGLSVSGVGAGVIGTFGLEGRYFLSKHWGVGTQLLWGSAVRAGLSLQARWRKAE